VVSAGKIQQRIEIFHRLEIDVSAFSAVSAVRPTLGDALFTPEADAAVAAVPCFNPDFCLVYKHAS
jgi:hypothetical protein